MLRCYTTTTKVKVSTFKVLFVYECSTDKDTCLGATDSFYITITCTKIQLLGTNDNYVFY